MSQHYLEDAYDTLCQQLTNTRVLLRGILDQAHQIREERDALLAALRRIDDCDSDCGCSHDTDDCCERVGVFCPRCIAGTAILALPADEGGRSTDNGAPVQPEGLV